MVYLNPYYRGFHERSRRERLQDNIKRFNTLKRQRIFNKWRAARPMYTKPGYRYFQNGIEYNPRLRMTQLRANNIARRTLAKWRSFTAKKWFERNAHKRFRIRDPPKKAYNRMK